MVYDFHTHTSLSDGSLSPIELIRRALAKGYKAIALTDHVGIGYLDRIIREVAEDCALARAHWPILAIPGVELLTSLPGQSMRPPGGPKSWGPGWWWFTANPSSNP